ncbi:hypothetical protein CFAM422_002180 [Trichoderma lentiforme]|uniref:Uncharacterized protein n=1 Tax=Trichoderma lentiforme TaxID=1567552 RepID=A0A9P4XMN4_9HYPO|nr:hypothetical protein CFAM422_002180 [Trichoderma lentiforme]
MLKPERIVCEGSGTLAVEAGMQTHARRGPVHVRPGALMQGAHGEEGASCLSACPAPLFAREKTGGIPSQKGMDLRDQRPE